MTYEYMNERITNPMSDDYDKYWRQTMHVHFVHVCILDVFCLSEYEPILLLQRQSIGQENQQLPVYFRLGRIAQTIQLTIVLMNTGPESGEAQRTCNRDQNHHQRRGLSPESDKVLK